MFPCFIEIRYNIGDTKARKASQHPYLLQTNSIKFNQKMAYVLKNYLYRYSTVNQHLKGKFILQ